MILDRKRLIIRCFTKHKENRDRKIKAGRCGVGIREMPATTFLSFAPTLTRRQYCEHFKPGGQSDKLASETNCTLQSAESSSGPTLA